MASKLKKVKDFQIDLLKFLSDKNIPEVHIFHHVMNYWSNDSSMVSLQLLKDAITDLCEKKFIVSKNNAHTLLGVQGVSEDDQKNNTVCSILDEGRSYLKKFETVQKIKNGFLILLIVAAIYFIWHYRYIITYFFR